MLKNNRLYQQKI